MVGGGGGGGGSGSKLSVERERARGRGGGGGSKSGGGGGVSKSEGEMLAVDFMWSVLRFIVTVAVPYLVVRTLMEGIDSLNATRFAQGYVSCRSLLAL